MLSIEELKKIVGHSDFSDEDILEIRGLLYALVEQVFDAHQFRPKTLSADFFKDVRHDVSVRT